MDLVLEFLNNYQAIIMIIMIVLILIFLFIELLNRIELNRIEKRYKKLMKSSTGKSLEEMIIEYSGMVSESLEKVNSIESLYKSLDTRVKNSIQKYSVVRYRAFDDVGSDLSFSIAFLDEFNNGVVITGIYGRNESTTFAKPIENGISKYDLSDEEKLSIKNAMNKSK
jgi:hypothetical protein